MFIVSRWSVCMNVFSVAQLCLTLCNSVDCSPPGSSVHRFFRREYWNGLPFPPPGDLPDPRIEPTSPASPALAGSLPLSYLGSLLDSLLLLLLMLSHFSRVRLCATSERQIQQEQVYCKANNTRFSYSINLCLLRICRRYSIVLNPVQNLMGNATRSLPSKGL